MKKFKYILIFINLFNKSFCTDAFGEKDYQIAREDFKKTEIYKNLKNEETAI